MPSKRPHQKTAKFYSGLASKLSAGVFVLGLGGVITQYTQQNPTGMLIYTVFLVVGLVLTAAAVAEGR